MRGLDSHTRLSVGVILGPIMRSPWLMLVPIPGIGWWFFGFPPGWGWIVLPMIPGQPVTLGMLLVLATVVIGAYAGLAWLRSNF